MERQEAVSIVKEFIEICLGFDVLSFCVMPKGSLGIDSKGLRIHISSSNLDCLSANI